MQYYIVLENISLKETIHVQENELAKAKTELTKHNLLKGY